MFCLETFILEIVLRNNEIQIWHNNWRSIIDGLEGLGLKDLKVLCKYTFQMPLKLFDKELWYGVNSFMKSIFIFMNWSFHKIFWNNLTLIIEELSITQILTVYILQRKFDPIEIWALQSTYPLLHTLWPSTTYFV